MRCAGAFWCPGASAGVRQRPDELLSLSNVTFFLTFGGVDRRSEVFVPVREVFEHRSTANCRICEGVFSVVHDTGADRRLWMSKDKGAPTFLSHEMTAGTLPTGMSALQRPAEAGTTNFELALIY